MPTLLEKYPSLAGTDREDYVESHDGRESRLLTYIQSLPNLDATLRNNPPAILAAIDHYAAQKEFLINIGSDKARIVCDIIATERPKVVIEVGGYVGYSAVCFADAMRKANPEATGKGQGKGELKYYSLELEEGFCEIARKMVQLAGLEDVVEFVSGKAEDGLRKLKDEGKVGVGECDLLFLDHVEDLYIQELMVVEELGLVGKGKLVVADNVLRPGAPEYRKFVRDSSKYDSKAVKGLIMPGEFEDELEVTRVL